MGGGISRAFMAAKKGLMLDRPGLNRIINQAWAGGCDDSVQCMSPIPVFQIQNTLKGYFDNKVAFNVYFVCKHTSKKPCHAKTSVISVIYIFCFTVCVLGFFPFKQMSDQKVKQIC